MSIVAVQSGVGAHVLDSQPEEARKALAAVEVTSRQALTEMRRLLGVLRQEAEPAGSLTPSPGLAEGSANGRQESDSDRQIRRSAGHGILGMRERAALYGGTLDAGPLPGGGLRVAAHLPVEPGDRGGLPA